MPQDVPNFDYTVSNVVVGATPCPSCGSLDVFFMRQEAAGSLGRCRACWGLWIIPPQPNHRTKACPQCGGLMDREALRCIACYQKERVEKRKRKARRHEG